MTKRSAVYEAFDGERDYQDEKWGGNGTHGVHSITEFLVYIQDYTEEALHIVTHEEDETANQKALHIVRKIGALAVACMEQHGAPKRQRPYKIVGGEGQGGF
jgi:uncharacterized protein with FMN-binding domain